MSFILMNILTNMDPIILYEGLVSSSWVISNPSSRLFVNTITQT